MGGRVCVGCGNVTNDFQTCVKCNGQYICPKCSFCNYCGHEDKHLYYIKRQLQRKRESKENRIEELKKGYYVNLFELATLEKQIELLENIYFEFLYYK